MRARRLVKLSRHCFLLATSTSSAGESKKHTPDTCSRRRDIEKDWHRPGDVEDTKAGKVNHLGSEETFELLQRCLRENQIVHVHAESHEDSHCHENVGEHGMGLAKACGRHFHTVKMCTA